MSKVLFTCTIPGRAYVKKNQQRTVGYGKSKRVIYTPQFIAWNRMAIVKLKQAAITLSTIDHPIDARFRFFFKNRSGECDCGNVAEGIQDALTQAGIIEDDRLIHILHVSKTFGEDPRVEIELKEIA